jgi:hypothetical protein
MAEYRIEVWSADTGSGNDFGPLSLLAEFENAKNIGYAYYLNDIGEAFWTINQDDRHATSAVRAAEGTGHVKIFRNGKCVWRGLLAEHDANHTDAILYAYGYESVLYYLLSGWNNSWKNKKIAGGSKRPVDELWGKVQTRTNSQLQFASTGTLQAPATTSNGGTDITLNSYKVYYKRILHIFKELVAMAVSDTTNVCYFELDYPTTTAHTLTFNFWKDNGTDITDKILEYPGSISGFSDRHIPIFARNDIKSVGTGARDQLFRITEHTTTGTYGSNAFGRRQEPLYFNWVRDEAEQTRVLKSRARKARREDVNVYLRMWPDDNMLIPARAPQSGYELGDRLKVVIDRGLTQINKFMFLEGEQVVVVNGMEHVQPIFADRAAS